MPLQYVTAMVNVGMRGDTIVQIEPPVSYPEFLVIQAINGGPQSTIDAAETSIDETGDVVAERERLVQKYGKELMDELFPGVLARLPEKGDLPAYEALLDAKKAADEARAKALSASRSKSAAPAAPKKPISAAIDGANDLGTGK